MVLGEAAEELGDHVEPQQHDDGDDLVEADLDVGVFVPDLEDHVFDEGGRVDDDDEGLLD